MLHVSSGTEIFKYETRCFKLHQCLPSVHIIQRVRCNSYNTQYTVGSCAFRRRRRLSDWSQGCLNGLTEVTCNLQSVRVFCQIKIIYLKGDNLQSNAFHNIWQQLPGPPSPSSPPPLTSHLTSVDNYHPPFPSPWPSHMSIIKLLIAQHQTNKWSIFHCVEKQQRFSPENLPSVGPVTSNQSGLAICKSGSRGSQIRMLKGSGSAIQSCRSNLS